VDVGIEPVADREAGVVDVAVDVVGEQRRPKTCEENNECGDRAPDQPPVQPRCQRQRAKVGGEAGPDQSVGNPR
jgi:hypothetical protein